jgi:hypothetical protein
MAGGNFVLSLEPHFRDGLLRGSDETVAAWKSLGRTAAWLRANAPVFGQPMLPLVTMLLENTEASLELANLSYRQNVSPALVPAANPPAPDPAHCWELVAVSIKPPAPDVRRRILANAQAGTTLVVDAQGEQAWWRVPGLEKLREDPDRDYYSLGKGHIVSYKEEVLDPSDLALDLIDYVTQARRPARIYNCNAGVVMAAIGPKSGPATGTAALYVVNYGRPVDLPVLARIQGVFTKATLLRPEGPPLAVKVSKRGSSSEATIPQLERVGVVVFG